MAKRLPANQVKINTALNGKAVGSLPYGYKYVGKSYRKRLVSGERVVVSRDVVIDPSKANLVKEAFKLYLQGMRGSELNSYIEEKYGVTRFRSNIYQILRNPFYMGVQKYDGKLYPHNYEKIISEEDWNLVQRLRESAPSGPTSATTFPYCHVIRCGDCDGYLKGEYHKRNWKNDSYSYTYYWCKGKNNQKHPRLNTTADIVTRIIKENFQSINRNIEKLKPYINPSIELYGIFNFMKEISEKDAQFFSDNKVILRSIFKKISFCRKGFTIDLNEPFHTLSQVYPDLTSLLGTLFTGWELYSNNRYLKSIIDNYHKPKETLHQDMGDPILTLCLTPRSLEDIMKHLDLPLLQVQERIIDLQLQDMINEFNGLWQTNKG